MPERADVPHRIRWAISPLDVQPDDNLLEIGPGNGVAIELVCACLGGRGSITAATRPGAAERLAPIVERALNAAGFSVSQARSRTSTGAALVGLRAQAP